MNEDPSKNQPSKDLPLPPEEGSVVQPSQIAKHESTPQGGANYSQARPLAVAGAELHA